MHTCLCEAEQCVLCPAQLYRGLTAEQVCQARGLLSRHEYAPRAFLFCAGEPSRRLYVLRAGRVKLTRSLPDGREQILGLCEPGDLLGLDALAGECYTHSAQALTPAAACALAYPDLVKVFEQNPAVTLRVLERLRAELARAQRHISELGLKSATERVASYLLSLVPPGRAVPVRLSLPLTRQEMAELLGLTVETVSRTMTELARRGVVQVLRGGHECVILDAPRLRRLAGEEGADSRPARAPLMASPSWVRSAQRP